MASTPWFYVNLVAISIDLTLYGPEIRLTAEDDEGSGWFFVRCDTDYLPYLAPYAALLSAGDRPAIPVQPCSGTFRFSATGAAHDHPGVDLSDLAGLIAHAPTRMG